MLDGMPCNVVKYRNAIVTFLPCWMSYLFRNGKSTADRGCPVGKRAEAISRRGVPLTRR